MKQLGLKIVKSLNGYIEVAEINGDASWTKKVHDIRTECEPILGWDKKENTTVIMYTADTVGEYYTVIAPILSGRANDFISAWVFRPWGLEIEGKQLLSIIMAVRDGILAKVLNTDKLEELFAPSYPEADAQEKPIPTNGEAFGMRAYNKARTMYTLAEMFDRGLAQSINAGHKAIFLIDGGYQLDVEALSDISNTVMEKAVTVYPPASSEVAKAKGFVPYLFGKEFDQPIKAHVDSTLEVVWKKDKYQDIEKATKVKEDGCTFEIPAEHEMKRYVNYSDIVVEDEDGRQLENYTLQIAKKELGAGKRMALSESALKEAEVTVNCQGFKKYTKTHDLTKKVRVCLVAVVNTYKFEVVDSDMPIKFEIETKKQLNRTPLEGYHTVDGYGPIADRVNHIEYKPSGFSFKMTAIIAGVVLVLGIAIGALCYGGINSAIQKHNKKSEVRQEQKDKQKDWMRQREEQNEQEAAAQSGSAQASEPDPAAQPGQIEQAAGGKKEVKKQDGEKKNKKGDKKKDQPAAPVSAPTTGDNDMAGEEWDR